MNRRIKLLLIFLCISLCPLRVYSQALSDSQVNDMLGNGFVVNSKADESQVKKQLGKPLHIRIKKVTNPYSEMKDVVTYYIYNGLEIIFYECKNPGLLWKSIVSIKVSNKMYKLKYGIKIGMKIRDVEQLFKGRECYTWESDSIKYYSFSMPDSVHDQIIFAVKNGIVQQVIWSNWP